MIVAIVIAVMASLYIARDNLISGCIRTSDFKNTEALAWETAASQRQADADNATGADKEKLESTALSYRNTAFDIRLTIPVAKDPELSTPRGALKSDRAQGCREAFPPPIPFVD